MTFLPFIEAVDGFPYNTTSGFSELVAHDGKTAIGYVNDKIRADFVASHKFIVNESQIIIKPEYDTFDKRCELFAQLASEWRQFPHYDELLNKGWRDELYVVYNPSRVPYMNLERAFSVLIGVVTYGVHVNGYVPASKTKSGVMKLWIPRRSPTKPTYPGMLDNTVAGGLGVPYGLHETVVKECFEEAGLPEQFVLTNTKSAGVVLYLYRTEDNRVQPEVEYIYDIEFDDETTIVPNPQDGEAEDFQLMTLDEVVAEVKAGHFKPNCALVIVDFLIRHGIITPENEPNYHDIVLRCHRKSPFPIM
jgi:isopentenyldiphosphate isomerase